MIEFYTSPDRYRHWSLTVDGEHATLALAVDPEHPFADGYELKLNSYDLGVDIELQDAIQRLRFEHPGVKVLTVTSGVDRVFCAGANIGMLGRSGHPFKVNFCKFTNETRLGLEDLSRNSGVRTLAAVNGPCAGGGYELAISCDDIVLIDDNSSAVSLPEVPLLGVLPGTGGLTRLVDKRHIRRDLADVFSTLADGVRGKKAVKWRLVDDTFPKSKWNEKIAERVATMASNIEGRAPAGTKGVVFGPIERTDTENGWKYEYVEVALDQDKRTVTLTVHAPDSEQPADGDAYLAAGDRSWAIRCFRELDDALCHIRFEHLETNIVLLHTRGDHEAILSVEKTLAENQDHWLVREITLQMARVLRRYELTARSFFALVDRDSAFVGSFFELALAGDRIYAIDDPDHPVHVQVGPLSDGLLPMSNGLTRLQSRFLAEPAKAATLAKEQPRLDVTEADEQGLITMLVEDLDWDDDVRIAIEERASFSPDALTGMEASLRYGGAETCDSKIFGRLSAWQNWIFTRPNAVGAEGALVRYFEPEAPTFDWKRT